MGFTTCSNCRSVVKMLQFIGTKLNSISNPKKQKAIPADEEELVLSLLNDDHTVLICNNRNNCYALRN